MMMKDPKKITTIILSRLKDGKSTNQEVKPSEEMESEQDELSVAAEELMDAIHSKDIPALKSALKSFIEMSDKDEESSEDEQSE